MGYDRGDSFLFDFEPNEILFGSKSKGKLSPRSYPIECERKYSFLSVREVSVSWYNGSPIDCPAETLKWKYSFLSVQAIMYLHTLAHYLHKPMQFTVLFILFVLN